MALILGIETSCDETAAAVFCTEEQRVLSSAIFSQIDLHKVYGGVVPEVASRSHMQKIRPIIEQALKEADLNLNQICGIGVTNRPGLAGSLLIGLSYAKALSAALEIPFIAIDHLEGHIFSAHFAPDDTVRTHLTYPYLSFSASGGHTALYSVSDLGKYEQVGHTRDDAAGEAFDKIAKLIGLGYPGGPIIEQLAQENEFKDVYNYPRTKQKPGEYFFSFSGLKTAIFYDLMKRGFVSQNGRPTVLMTREVQRNVASSMLVCVGDIFVKTIERVLKDSPELTGVTFVGGVACNAYLRMRIEKLCKKRSLFFEAAPKKYCTDNGAMIALVASYRYARGESSYLDCDIFEE